MKFQATQFLDKNRDTLRADLVQLLIQSTNSLISQMFQELYDAIVSKLLVKTTAVYSAVKPRTSTVAASFIEELQSLIVTMTKYALVLSFLGTVCVCVCVCSYVCDSL